MATLPSGVTLKFMEMADGRPETAAVDASPGAKWRHPPSFYCPISHQILQDPVVLCDGHTYERKHIERWLQEHNSSPVSNEQLPQKAVFPNHSLRKAIEEYFEQVFSVHRRAIRKSIGSADTVQESLFSNEQLVQTIDALMQCSLLMNADESSEVVLKQIMHEAKTLLGAEAASVFLVDPEKQELYSTVNSTSGELRIPIVAGIAGYVASTGEPLVIDDTYADERFDKTNDMKTGFTTHNMMCVPLKVKNGGVLGVVQLINKTGSKVFPRSHALATVIEEGKMPTFTSQDLQFLQVFASQAATAVANCGGEHRQSELQTSQSHWSVAGTSYTWHPTTNALNLMSCFCLGRQRQEAPLKTNPVQTERPECGVEDHASAGKPELRSSSEDRVSRSGEDESPKVEAALQSSVIIAERTTKQLPSQAIDILADAFDGWQFDAFALAELTENRPLSTLGMYLFENLGLVKHFDLDEDKLRRFFIEIENGYDDANSYHNRAHAASVLHAMHALLEQGGISEATASAFSAVDGSRSQDGHIERLACLLAAAVHDFEHKGVSNDFLVRSCDARALVYNDQHVNEHHHVAAAFAMLRRPECNFLCKFSLADFRWIRSIVIEIVLATDMANGGKILKSFNDIFATQIAGGKSPPEFASAKDALLLLQVAMKCADIGHLALNWDLHRKWVSRLEEEFFAQGDREKALGHSVSFLMDRNKPGCSQTQTGFFEFVVLPLFRSLVAVAPRAQPVLDAIDANYKGWQKLAEKRELEEEKDK